MLGTYYLAKYHIDIDLDRVNHTVCINGHGTLFDAKRGQIELLTNLAETLNKFIPEFEFTATKYSVKYRRK
jgi:hypothetical protein